MTKGKGNGFIESGDRPRLLERLIWTGLKVNLSYGIPGPDTK
jgi:hypothetical protein